MGISHTAFAHNNMITQDTLSPPAKIVCSDWNLKLLKDKNYVVGLCLKKAKEQKHNMHSL